MTREVSVFRKRVPNDGFFKSPREVQIHRLAMEAQTEGDPFTAKLLGYRRGIFSTVLHIERLEGRSPRHIGELGDIGALIAGIEVSTHRLIRGTSIDPKLDFYLSGAGRKPRYNITAIANAFTQRRQHPFPFPDFTDIVMNCAASVEVNDSVLAGAEPVVSHLDHFLKNFIRTDERLFLIDWGEGYIGRAGFDAGCFLMMLFRTHNLARFEPAAVRFCKSYLGRVTSFTHVLSAMNRVFLPRSLWYLLRHDVVDRYHSKGQREEWAEKLRLLDRVASGQFWKSAGLM
ncbi:hypothetical protein ACI2KT_18865 [Ensifer adhaerens]|uniref:hypothetical protein n=1 Tax=Ensifer adhaerens TaxID=106592 RepID=UPI0038510CA3